MASPVISISPLHRSSTFQPIAAATATPNSSTPTPLSPASPSHLDTFSSDPILSAFLSHDFNPTYFPSSALSSGSAASRIEVRLLDTQLRHEVLSRHHGLLHQLSSTKAAESSLSSLRTSVSSLQSTVRHARSKLSDPHRVISAQTLQLNNLHSTSSLLQYSIRTLRSTQKLRNLVNSQPDASKWDLSKAAQLHYEILTLYNESHLSGIDVVDV
ncbi:hypothetical protein DH2020_011347 [Rehmannia glutinosa]|uniref:Conserved oligomeric Golgi complex subunit 5 N-terminal domain-containing protein n=1 Tax=Rehmannia glutinosa TaxID=99300 RepID=A0ABR0XD59_REHGL